VIAGALPCSSEEGRAHNQIVAASGHSVSVQTVTTEFAEDECLVSCQTSQTIEIGGVAGRSQLGIDGVYGADQLTDAGELMLAQ
jgi:hypothetical protein